MYHVDKYNLGVFLAIIAGLIALGVAIWPIAAPQASREFGDIWLIAPFAAGAAFMAAAFIVDRWPTASRLLLGVGGLVMLVSGVLSGLTMAPETDPQTATLAALIDIVPGALALIAALLIGPMAHRAEDL